MSDAPLSIPIPQSGVFSALLRIPIPYLLEVYESNALAYVVTLPQNPSIYEQKRPSATVVTHTLNEVVRELSENHLTEITLSGSSGRAERLGHTRTGGASVLNGRQIMEEFDAFLDRYQTRASDSDSFMVFRALDENQAYKVEPLEWEWKEDASAHRFSYEWTLKLEAYEHAHERNDINIFPSLSAGLEVMSQMISAVSAVPALAGVAVNNIGEVARDVGTVAENFSRLAVGLLSAVNNADGVKTYVSETLPRRLVQVGKRFDTAVQRFHELLDIETKTRWRNSDDELRHSIAVMRQTLLISPVVAGLSGLRRLPPIETRTVTDTTTNAIEQIARELVRYTVRAGDTLQSIALRAYGDSSLWIDIAQANNMRGSRYLADGRTLSVGDTIVVPRNLLTRASEDPYGTDFLLNENGDLELTSDNDLRIVSGVKNLKQALRNRLTTTLGSCWLMPSYGLPLRLGDGITASLIAHAVSHVRDQIERENRIDTVHNVQILQEGDKLAVELQLQPILGDATTIVTPYI